MLDVFVSSFASEKRVQACRLWVNNQGYLLSVGPAPAPGSPILQCQARRLSIGVFCRIAALGYHVNLFLTF